MRRAPLTNARCACHASKYVECCPLQILLAVAIGLYATKCTSLPALRRSRRNAPACRLCGARDEMHQPAGFAALATKCTSLLSPGRIIDGRLRGARSGLFRKSRKPPWNDKNFERETRFELATLSLGS